MLNVRSSVHALQCPRCVLRFASTSELEQHLRLDHQPPKPEPEGEPRLHVASSQGDATRGPVSADESARLNRLVVRVIALASVTAFVSVFSWRAAALLTVAALAGAALRSTIRAHSRAGRART